MELDPKYASVIVRRYINTVGTDKDVFLLRDGEKISYADIKKTEAEVVEEEPIL